MNSDFFSDSGQKRVWTEVFVVAIVGLLMTIGLFFWNPYAGVAGFVGSVFLSTHSYLRERE